MLFHQKKQPRVLFCCAWKGISGISRTRELLFASNSEQSTQNIRNSLAKWLDGASVWVHEQVKFQNDSSEVEWCKLEKLPEIHSICAKIRLIELFFILRIRSKFHFYKKFFNKFFKIVDKFNLHFSFRVVEVLVRLLIANYMHARNFKLQNSKIQLFTEECSTISKPSCKFDREITKLLTSQQHKRISRNI